MKKTIVIFIGGYLPGKKYGGPVTSLENFSNQMCDKYNIRIICSDHDFKENRRYEGIIDGWNSVGNAQVYYTNENQYTYDNFMKIIKPFEHEIELFYLSGIYYIKMNYFAIRVAEKLGITVLLAPRGDLMKNTIEMNNKAKMIKKLIFLKVVKMFKVFDNIYFQSTSEEETFGLKNYLNVNSERIIELPNMTRGRSLVNKKMKNKDEIRIMFISRLMVKKNLYFALEVIEKIDEKYRVIFDIYGPQEDYDYFKKCEDKIEKINNLNSNCTIFYKGSLDPSEAKNVYSKYDCFLFPTKSENYGHVIVEAMFSNCPVILSKGTTPWDDYDKNGGYVISLENKDEFVKCLEDIAHMDELEYSNLILLNKKYIENKFRVEELKQEYINMINIISKR